MSLYITEYCKVTGFKDGLATGTFAIPAELLDELMLLASTLLNATRILKIKAETQKAESRLSIARTGARNK